MNHLPFFVFQLSKEDDLHAEFASYTKLKTQQMPTDNSSEDSEAEEEQEDDVAPHFVHKHHKGASNTIMRPSPVIEKVRYYSATESIMFKSGKDEPP